MPADTHPEIPQAAARAMLAALEFYADRKSYNSVGGYARMIDRDMGRRAQEALGTYVNPFDVAAATRGGQS